MLHAPLDYADRRWKIFPLKPGKKIPITPKGHLDATTDIDQITEWWTIYPTANIGVNLSASGLIAIDVDAYKADCKWDEYRGCNICDAGFTQKSHRGGCHYVFEVDPTNDFIGSPCLGVDIKHNGYIVLTPSTFEGKSYQVIRHDDVTPLPSWLTDKIRKSTSSAFDIDLGYRSGDHDTDEVLKSEIMTGQNWHTNVLKLTGRYVKRGMLDDQIHAITDRFTLPGYTVPETQSEVQKMIHGARTKGFEKSNSNGDGLSDDALALKLGRLDFDQNAKFVPEWGAWLFWSGKVWEKSKVEAFSRTRAYLRRKAALCPKR